MKAKIPYIIFFMLFLGLFTVAASEVSIAATGELRVAFVDLQKALESSTAGASAQTEYEKKVKSAQAELDKAKASFDKMEGEFAKQKNSLSESARVEKQEKLLSKQKALRRILEDTQAKLRRENQRIVSALVTEIRKVVNDYGKKEGFTVILERGSQAVLYADNAIDITEDVIKVFNEKKPSL